VEYIDMPGQAFLGRFGQPETDDLQSGLPGAGGHEKGQPALPGNDAKHVRRLLSGILCFVQENASFKTGRPVESL